jgi:pSer/pThr/pTyr-binding forkhead associated (FHA) protein
MWGRYTAPLMDVGLVCDECSTFNPMGATSCSKCQAALTLAPIVAESEPEPSAVSGPECPACGAEIAEGMRFCGACGSKIYEETQPAVDLEALATAAKQAPRSVGTSKKTLFFGAMQAARAKLVLIKGDGLDGVSFTLAGDEHIAGREDAPLLFHEDPFMSPTHANFFYRNGQLVVRDESSVNGVYIRIRGTTPIGFGDRFLIGEQVLEVQEALSSSDVLVAEEDGTYFYSSPRRAGNFRIVQMLRGGDSGLAHHPDAETVTLGREGNDVNFPEDPFISGRHAQVSSTGSKLSLSDLGSKNGTFKRINDEATLEHGDYVFMGQQLLRVEIV